MDKFEKVKIILDEILLHYQTSCHKTGPFLLQYLLNYKTNEGVSETSRSFFSYRSQVMLAFAFVFIT